MEHSNIISLLKKVKLQRNILVGIVAVCFLKIFLLTFAVFSKDSKTILLPSIISNEYTLTKSSVSNYYIESIALDFSQLLLNVSPETAKQSFERFLNNVDSNHYKQVLDDLNLILDDVIRKKISTVFHIKTMTSNDEFQVILTGNYKKIVSKTVIYDQEERYLVEFTYKGGRLWVKSFNKLNKEKK